MRSPFFCLFCFCFSGSVNRDSLFFTGKWSSESWCGRSHVGSARGGAAAARGGATELMGALVLALLSWESNTGTGQNRKTERKKHRTADRDETERERERERGEEDRVKKERETHDKSSRKD